MILLESNASTRLDALLGLAPDAGGATEIDGGDADVKAAADGDGGIQAPSSPTPSTTADEGAERFPALGEILASQGIAANADSGHIDTKESTAPADTEAPPANETKPDADAQDAGHGKGSHHDEAGNVRKQGASTNKKRGGKGKKRKKKPGKLARILPIFGLIFGFALLLYPVVTDMYFAYMNSKAISSMTSNVDYQDDKERLRQKRQAVSYNAKMGGVESANPLLEGETLEPYEEQLVWTVPYISWIKIPKINTELAIYHGIKDETLAQGVGHLEQTSLPIGIDIGDQNRKIENAKSMQDDENHTSEIATTSNIEFDDDILDPESKEFKEKSRSHCVLSAHSGLSSFKLFDDIRFLDKGDKICLFTLMDPYAYEVYDTEVVTPDKVEHLYIYDAEHRDELTLLTCTPIGINSHRLMVHCKRIPYNPADFETSPLSSYLNTRTLPPIIIGLIIIAIAAMAERRRRRMLARSAFERQSKVMEQKAVPIPDAAATATTAPDAIAAVPNGPMGADNEARTALGGEDARGEPPS